jgi:methanogenic corrinoid protein MtbC1
MKTVVVAALCECVHVAGVSNFLRLAEAAGWRTVFLGPAVSIEELLAASRRAKADLVGVSVRGMDSIIRMACILHHTDYWKRTRTVDKLGIGDLSVCGLTRYPNEGIRE